MYIKFQVAGFYSGMSDVEMDGQAKTFARIDYYGGKVSLPCDEAEKKRFARIPAGAVVMAFGNVQPQGNGTAKIKVMEIRTEGDEGFEEPTQDQLMQGCVYQGLIGVNAVRDYVRQDGTRVFRIDGSCIGGIMNFESTREINASVQKGGRYTVLGTMSSYLTGEMYNGQRKTVLQVIPQIVSVEDIQTEGRKRRS